MCTGKWEGEDLYILFLLGWSEEKQHPAWLFLDWSHLFRDVWVCAACGRMWGGVTSPNGWFIFEKAHVKMCLNGVLLESGLVLPCHLSLILRVMFSFPLAFPFFSILGMRDLRSFT